MGGGAERGARLVKFKGIFQQWVAQLPVMAIGGDIISFDDYRDRVTGANIDFRPTEDILQELEDVESRFKGGAAGDGG